MPSVKVKLVFERQKNQNRDITNMLKELLGKGYFPREIPIPFTSAKYADVMCSPTLPKLSPFSYGKKGPNYNSKCASFNLARRGNLRRVLSIPNPINQFHTAKSISDNWALVDSHYNKTNQSISKPVKDDIRALTWEKGFAQLSDHKLITRSSSKFILQADINNFYPSIYTHSIPWALHTKPISKNNFKFSAYVGNQFDTHIRNCQEKQTKGIPIGPDTSFAIAEVILSAIDQSLTKSIGSKYHRYIDDFEFGCSSYQQAESTLSKLQEELGQFELTLNSSKTKILETPFSLDPIWLHDLKRYNFRTGSKKQKNDLYHYFDLVMFTLQKYPNESIAKYAILKSSSQIIYYSNWQTYQSIILQWSLAEPEILPIALDLIRSYESMGYPISKSEILETLEFLIAQHAPLGHTSEICYAIFGMMLFKLPFSQDTITILENIENPFIALLTLDAQQQRLIPKSHVFNLWQSLMVPDELKTSNWLLAYEALIKEWLPPAKGSNYLDTIDGFKYLKSKKVEFYDTTAISRYKPIVKYWTLNDISQEQLAYFFNSPSFKDSEPKEEVSNLEAQHHSHQQNL